TAEICARLVMIGIGYEAALFEKETQIRVSRTRSLGPGGWSQNRYRRHSHAAILQSTRDVQTQLDAQGIEYDLSVRKSDFGLEKSLFLVYEAIDEVLSFIKPYMGSTIQVKVTPVKKKEIEFIPLTSKEDIPTPVKNLIVGIDPGTTTGIAILDLTGNILALRSGKEISRRDLIKYIANYGSAVLIATDVVELPRYVEKIANTFNAIIYRPRKLMKVSEKQELVSEYLRPSKKRAADAHIRDALACAIKAYYSYLHIFEKIQKKVHEMNIDVPLDKVKVLVMRGYSIYDALSILTFKPDEDDDSVLEDSTISESTELNKLTERVFTLIDKNLQFKQKLQEYQETNLKLVKELEQRTSQISRLKQELEKVRSKTFYRLRGERLIRAQTSEINQLRAMNTNLKQKVAALEANLVELQNRTAILEELEREQLANNIIILKVIDNFSKDAIDRIELSPNDVLYMLDGSGGGSSTAEQLINISNEIQAIITNTLSHEAYEQFKKAGIPIIPVEELRADLNLKVGVYYVNKRAFEQKVKIFKEKQYTSDLQEAEVWLHNLITDYRKRKIDK
ncbi:MAG: DUF460 domain-containing protein, partial [Candidatus Helarchaeota archaeon]